MAINDVLQVTIEAFLHGQQVVTVLHYAEANPPDTLTSENWLSAAVQTIVVPAMKGLQSAELGHAAVSVQKIWPLPPNVPVRNTTGAGGGNIAGSSLPTCVTAVITKQTAFAGRKYRGRMFIPGVPVASENDSQLSAAAMVTWQAAADAMNVTLSADNGEWNMVLWHRSTKTWHTVLKLLARSVLRNQRRRQVGKGV